MLVVWKLLLVICISYATATSVQKKPCTTQCDSQNQPVCGSDGTTYINKCHMEKAACMLGKTITIMYMGDCKPKLQDMDRNVTTKDKPPKTGLSRLVENLKRHIRKMTLKGNYFRPTVPVNRVRHILPLPEKHITRSIKYIPGKQEPKSPNCKTIGMIPTKYNLTVKITVQPAPPKCNTTIRLTQPETTEKCTSPKPSTPKCNITESPTEEVVTLPPTTEERTPPKPPTPECSSAPKQTAEDCSTPPKPTTPECSIPQPTTEEYTNPNTTIEIVTAPKPATPECSSPQPTTDNCIMPEATTAEDTTTPAPITPDCKTRQATTENNCSTTPKPTTEKCTTPKPTTPECTTPQPTTEEDSTTPKPTTEECTTPKPTTPECTTPQPTTEEDSTTPKPTTEVCTTPKPTTPECTTLQPTTEDITTPQPTTEDITTLKTTTEECTTPKPTTPECATTQPTTEDNTTLKTTTEECTTPKPSTPECTTPQPTTEEDIPTLQATTEECTTPKPTTPECNTPQPTTEKDRTTQKPTTPTCTTPLPVQENCTIKPESEMVYPAVPESAPKGPPAEPLIIPVRENKPSKIKPALREVPSGEHSIKKIQRSRPSDRNEEKSFSLGFGCPKVCPTEVKPVCGSDGHTYNSLCLLKKKCCHIHQVIKVKYQGKCKHPSVLLRKFVPPRKIESKLQKGPSPRKYPKKSVISNILNRRKPHLKNALMASKKKNPNLLLKKLKYKVRSSSKTNKFSSRFRDKKKKQIRHTKTEKTSTSRFKGRHREQSFRPRPEHQPRKTGRQWKEIDEDCFEKCCIDKGRPVLFCKRLCNRAKLKMV